jgi:formylglycine-generating enzyme
VRDGHFKDNSMNSWSRVLLLLTTLLLATSANYADSFGSGANSFTIDFVTIGAPGNPADTTGEPNPAGSVPYTYRIGKYEVPEDAVRKANALGGLGITLDSRGPNKPATSVSWLEAARFVNWLNSSSGAPVAYKFDSAGNYQLWTPSDPGFNAANRLRNTLARYFLPSIYEWYKAAFFDPTLNAYWDYATGSDSAPAAVASGTVPNTAVWDQPFDQGPADVSLSGGASPLGTLGQSGNVNEWLESLAMPAMSSIIPIHAVRGGDWIGPSSDSLSLSSSFTSIGSRVDSSPLNVGFRIAREIPEPSCVFLGGASAILIALYRGQTVLGSS